MTSDQPYDEVRYRQETLDTFFKLTAIITLAMGLIYLFLYYRGGQISALILMIGFSSWPLVSLICLRLLHQDQTQLALQIFMSGATGLAILYTVLMPMSVMLIGMMGIFLLVRITTFLETSKGIIFFGTLWAVVYLIALGIRTLLNIPPLALDSLSSFFEYGIPIAILIVFVRLDRTMTLYLREVLLKSERSRWSLVQSYDQLAQQKKALELSEQKLAAVAAKLEEANAGLQRANDDLKSFAYVISHDIRAPLRAIHNYAEFLREASADSLDPDSQGYLNNLSQCVDEAEELVSDLFRFSKIGYEEIEIEPVDVAQILSSLVASLDLSPDNEIIVADKWPALCSEPILLRQIFQNLILNGIKFNNASPKRVEVGCGTDDQDYWEFYVRDNGIGIDRRHHRRIFQVFQRLHTKTQYEGTGIGLAIVKKTVEKLGGSIRLESAPGVGSTFFIRLPKS